jgi:predicted lipoprotein with Yx(FWY)xxD motif
MHFTPSHQRSPDRPIDRPDRRRWPRRTSPVLLAAAGGMLIAGCGGVSYASSAAHTAHAHTSAPTSTAAGDPPGSSGSHHHVRARVLVRHTRLGPIIVDGRGRTLYMFTRDHTGKITCIGTCARFWPPYTTRGRPAGGPGVERSLLGVTHLDGGPDVVTYHGHPLYRFVKDTRPGQVSGENAVAFGGRWDVLSPSGLAVTGHHARATAPRAGTTPATTPSTATAPPPTATTPPAPTTTTRAAQPPSTTTQAAPPPSTTTSSGSGIPQNGGGDDDGDNHGSASDGDGDL